MLRSRLTEKLKLTHPVILAPMGLTSGGKLAAAVSAAGGLGLIGGGRRDETWLREQFAIAGTRNIGCGLITWAIERQPQTLDVVLEGAPRALCLSFGDPQPYAERVKRAGVPFICQIQTLEDARRAIDVGADIVVAQGAEAGGHGEKRATLTLVPEVADLLSARSPATLLCAAGGIADGRGLAAALVLGADGAMIGSRFWASEEALPDLAHPNLQKAAVAASGDDTMRTRVWDILLYDDQWRWPERYNIRALKNETTARWHGREAELQSVLDAESKAFAEAHSSGDARIFPVIVGEAVGLIHEIASAKAILENIVAEAEGILHQKVPRWLSS